MADLSFTVDVPVLVWGQMSLVVGVIAVMIVYWILKAIITTIQGG